MKSTPVLVLLVTLCLATCAAVRATGQTANQLAPVPIQSVNIDDPFWSPKRQVWQEVTIPDCFDKFENDRGGALNNFDRVRDGKTGGHAGPPWYDGLIYETITGAADFLAAHPDAALEQRIDGYIGRIARAQERDPDGYLNTWTQLLHPTQRWGLHGGNDGYQHEMYRSRRGVRGGRALLCRHRQTQFAESRGKTGQLHVRSSRAGAETRTGPQSRHR